MVRLKLGQLVPGARPRKIVGIPTLGKPTGETFSATVYRGTSEHTPLDEGLYGKGTHYSTNKGVADMDMQKLEEGLVKLGVVKYSLRLLS